MAMQQPEWVAVVGHFCETHGPVAVMATYKAGAISPPVGRAGGCVACRLDRTPVLEDKCISSVPPREFIPQLQKLCLRAFVVPDSSEDAPLMLADPEMGTAIVQQVRLGPRLYVLGLLSSKEGVVMRSWGKIIDSLSRLAVVLKEMAMDSAFRILPREPRSLANVTSPDVWEIIHKEFSTLIL